MWKIAMLFVLAPPLDCDVLSIAEVSAEVEQEMALASSCSVQG